MKKQLGRAVRSTFESRLREQFPQFQRQKSAEGPLGDRVHEWQFGKGLAFYLELTSHRYRDAITLEVAWSTKARCPSHLFGLSPVDIPRCEIRQSAPEDGEFRFRIGLLWPPHEDFWWRVSQEPEPDLEELANVDFTKPETVQVDSKFIAAQIDDVMCRIRVYVIPYFEKVAADQMTGNSSS